MQHIKRDKKIEKKNEEIDRKKAIRRVMAF